ncbi:sulfite oxidase [Virgisporangium aurantiacum]|uniref:Oxidoreductase n=1 Tax=Virgisporangium aurantiacum TaxID=175570 RepID=A0A8J3Z8V5_9ACTN|nr:sulfite oxidase [Virgisporangium aurantiacum]GIJ57065.1 oxidoreductase [Virgisporangium aurantiacum]
MTVVEPRPVVHRPGRLGRFATAAGRAAAIGLPTAGVALGVAHVVAAALGRPQTAPVLAVGSTVIDATPRPLKDFAIREFGTHDKVVLLSGVYLLLVLFAVGLGAVAGRRRAVGYAGLAVFVGIGVVAVVTRPASTGIDALPTLVGGVVAAVALIVQLRFSQTTTAADAARPRLLNRRQFLVTTGAAAAVAASAGAGGVALGRTNTPGSRSRAAVRLPAPADPAPALPAGVLTTMPGGSAFVTANRDFYRVDTALTVPQIDANAWRLTVHGAVDRPATFTFDDLLRRPMRERDITLNCVSNEVGGPYVGTARWLGVPLAPLLREAGMRAGADQLVSRSTDGMTIGTPLDAVLDGRDAMLVVGMNGEPLPLEHGFPVRLLVPGLYGYVGACKWLTDLEVTTFDAFDAYWVRRGWAARAPVKTASRIDTPRPLTTIAPGQVRIAGVAWAQRRGISAVDVSVDNGQWQPAQLADGPSPDTWRQWVLRWDATPGLHTIRVRATDGRGDTQPEARAGTFPDGATGWHTISVTVSG